MCAVSDRPGSTYAVLLDTLNRHRGKGQQQKVTVEHVSFERAPACRAPQGAKLVESSIWASIPRDRTMGKARRPRRCDPTCLYCCRSSPSALRLGLTRRGDRNSCHVRAHFDCRAAVCAGGALDSVGSAT